MRKCFYRPPAPLSLESGGRLDQIEICYHVSHESVQDRKVIWICHALTANSNPEEWWEGLVGPGRYIDTDKHFVVCSNILGSCYGSSGPASNDPSNGKPYLRGFPLVTIRDMVAAHELLREHLGIHSIELLIGGSSGGFQAVEWAVTSCGVIQNLCLLACNARISPWGTALNEAQRMALRADQEFINGASSQHGKRGLEAARAIALLSYRSYKGYALTQSESDNAFLLAEKASSYQRYQGNKLSARFSAYSYYSLTLSLDTHNIGRGRSSVSEALKMISAKTLCIAVSSDMLFPVSEMEVIARNVPEAKLEVIDSAFGHDGFLLETEQIIEKLRKYFDL